MNYFEKFNAQKEKLENILEENGLLHKFKTDAYPMSLTITQNMAPSAQMALYETATEGASSRDAKLILTFPVGEIGIRMYGRLVISENLMNKIKNHGKKMRDLWLQANFAAAMLVESQKEPPAEDPEPGERPDYREFYEEDDE